MKVLFLSRKTLFSSYGGDTVQVLKTAETLRRKGVSVDISTELKPDLRGYDLVHVFNLTRPQETLSQMLFVKKKGIPIALSTIYVDYSEADKKARIGLFGYLAQWLGESKFETLKIVGRALLNGEIHSGVLNVLAKGYRNCMRQSCSMADVLLPNSFSELQRIEKRLELKVQKPVYVVPNAADMKFFSNKKTVISPNLKQYEGCILCVARIERSKNQINLIRAARNFPVPLLLAGAPAKNHKKYYKQILKEAGDYVVFLGHKSPEELRVLYKLCKVHALVSWMETTGLSSLEAAAMGANLVITDRGDTKEYFRDEAFYCEPDDVESIAAALKKALAAPPPDALQTRVRKDYTWDQAAAKTLEGYESALNR